MLKKCYRLFLGLLVMTGSACVTPTHASSASIIITNVQAGGQSGATEEGIVLYNNSSFELDITNWCVMNKSAIKFACFKAATQYEVSIIPAYSYATIVSIKAAERNSQGNYSLVYEPSAGSSGSIVASSDTISLVDKTGQLIDQFAWTSSTSSSQQWSRTKLSLLPDLFIDTDTSIDWQKATFNVFPASQIDYRDAEPPKDPTDEPIDNSTDESGGETNEAGDTNAQPGVILPAIITELLPNAVGSDTGNEFIEIYNPNELVSVSLNGYKLAVGPAFEKVITLSEYSLKPKEYKVFTNTQLSYSLLNSSSRVTLFTPNGEIANEVPAYDSPVEGESWALIDGDWEYSNQPTPGMANISFLLGKDILEAKAPVSSTIKTCASNQYRSPETNRCRLISSANSTVPALCKVEQVRNQETGRCKAIAVTNASVCKAGQERNPETNRCRNIKQLSTAAFGVKGATTQKQGGTGWYIWAAIIGTVLLIVGYGVWEWRVELRKLFQVVKAKFAGKAN